VFFGETGRHLLLAASFVSESPMGLSKEARAIARERERAAHARYLDRCAHEERVQTTLALAAIRTKVPDFKGVDLDGAEGLFDDDIENLPKWLGDIVDELAHGYGPPGNAAEAAAEAAAQKAYDEAYKAAYETTYTNAFNDAFALRVARHEGRTYYDGGDEHIRIEGPDAENVVPFS
jgi:hypothetical protein